jgi:hypothetical protein
MMMMMVMISWAIISRKVYLRVLLPAVKTGFTLVSLSYSPDEEQLFKTSDEIEDAQGVGDVGKRLLKVLPQLFSSNTSATEHSILFHDDISMQNILVSSSGKISDVIDWEYVFAPSLWRACQLRELLDGIDRCKEPQRYVQVVSKR